MDGSQKQRLINVVVDNESWILPYAQKLVDDCCALNMDAKLCRTHEDVREGYAAFYIGCTRLTPADILAKNEYNLVIHESDLPKGRGFAPMTWQILEGRNQIDVCLIEAADGDADSGDIYLRDVIALKGTELNSEWRALQGLKTIELCQEFLKMDNPQGKKQSGESSVYARRRPEDSRLDPNKTLAEQFDLLRVVDNERYPAFFEHRGRKYKIMITPDENDGDAS